MHWTGASEVRSSEDGGFCFCLGILFAAVNQLVVSWMWNLLCCGISSVDVYGEEFSFLNGLPYGVFELRIWHGSSNADIS